MSEYTVQCQQAGCGRIISSSYFMSCNETQTQKSVRCPSCGKNSYLCLINCDKCDKGVLFSNPEGWAESHKFRCYCKNILDKKIYGTTKVSVKKKKIGLWSVIESLCTKSYPKYVFDTQAICPNCNSDTVWYKFTREATEKYCCMCGEL